jgi:hypothetical protein
MKKKYFILFFSVMLFCNYNRCVAQNKGSEKKKVSYTVSADDKATKMQCEVDGDILSFFDEKGKLFAQYTMARQMAGEIGRERGRLPNGPICYPFCQSCEICKEFTLKLSNTNKLELYDQVSSARMSLNNLNASSGLIEQIVNSKSKTLIMRIKQ